MGDCIVSLKKVKGKWWVGRGVYETISFISGVIKKLNVANRGEVIDFLWVVIL